MTSESTPHWSARYIGRAYVPRVFDCAALAALVQREVFAREVQVPADRANAPGGRLVAAADQIEAIKAAHTRRVATPEDGDGVLMFCRGRPSHIGVACMVPGEAGSELYVLHALASIGQVVLHRARDLARYGLAVEGFYKWIG